MPERLGEGEHDYQERHGGDQRCTRRPARQSRGGCPVAHRDAPRDLARHRHLERPGRDQDDREEAEQRSERAVVLTAEDAPGREQEDVRGDDRHGCRGREDGAAADAARGAEDTGAFWANGRSRVPVTGVVSLSSNVSGISYPLPARRTRGFAYYVRVLRVVGVIQFRAKYTGAVLGYVWSLIKPLA